MTGHGTRGLSYALVMVLLGAASGVSITAAQAQQQTAQRLFNFNIASKPVPQAVNDIGRVTGLSVVFRENRAITASGRAIRGSMTAEQALSQLLQGTGLSYRFSNSNTVQIFDPSTTAGQGAVAADGSTVLQTIVVDGASADNNTVAASNSGAATKLDTPLIETARSVSVVTRKELEQRGVQSTVEAVRYAAGIVTDRAGFDPRFDTVEIRGYDATSTGDYKDGLRQPFLNYGMFRTDPYSLERVEIVKGPVSVLYGAGSPAGIINKVSKLAKGNRVREVEAMYGTKDRKQFAFDFGDVVGNDSDLSYRLVGLARVGKTNLDITDDRYFLQPSVTWAPSDQTRFTAYGLVQKSDTGGAVGAIVDPSGNVLNLRASDPGYDYNRITQQQVGYEFEHEFNDLVRFRQNVRYSHMDLLSRYLTVSSWTGTVAHRMPWAVRDNMSVFQTDNQLEWTFDTGPLSHTLLTGFDYTNASGAIGYGLGATDPAFDFDIANPTYGVSGPTAPYNYLLVDRDLKQMGVYAVDQIEIDRWHFTLGGRYTWVEQNANGTAGGAAVADDLDKGAFTFQASALYAFDNGISPFISYATSFDPVTNRSVSGTILDPTQGEQVELGIKYQPPGSDILLSAVAYHLVEQNKPVLVDAALSTYRSVGELTNKGIELEARANIASSWDVVAAYTYSHSRITAGSDVGNVPAVKPEHVASLWANYSFDEASILPGLSAGAGLRYASEAFTSTKNTDKNGATFYLDAALSYDFGAIDKKYDGLVAAFNIRNIADKRDAVCNEGYCSLAQGRNMTAALKYRW